MNYFRLVGVIESPLALFIDEALARPVGCCRYRAASVAALYDFGGEVVDCHVDARCFPFCAVVARGNFGGAMLAASNMLARVSISAHYRFAL